MRNRHWLLPAAVFVVAMVCLGLATRGSWFAPPGTDLAAPPVSPPRSQAPAPAPTPSPPGTTAPGRSAAAVPILMYHVIGDGPNNLFVSEADFRKQMTYLDQTGYHAVTLQQLYDAFTKNAPLPSRPIAITFDDGYVSHYTKAFPILQAHHFAGTFYVVSGFVGRTNYLTWPQVVEMDRAGMEMDAHTQHHVDLPSQPRPRLVAEVAGAKHDLEQHLGHAILGFCYPSGRYNSDVVDAVRSAGYLHATTTHPGLADAQQDPLLLPRIRVSRGETLEAFVAALGAVK